MKALLALALLAVSIAAHAQNPTNVWAEQITETSAIIRWSPTPAGSYTVWQEKQTQYMLAFVPVARNVLATQFRITGMRPGERRKYRITSAGYTFSSGVQTLSLRTLLHPEWKLNLFSCTKHYGLSRLTYRQFYPGLLYSCSVGFDGEPTPRLSLVRGPSGMVLSGKRLTWTGYQATSVTLRIENSLGRLDLTYQLNPVP